MYFDIPQPRYDFNLIQSSIKSFRPGAVIVEIPTMELANNQKMFQLPNGDLIKVDLQANDIGNITKYFVEIGKLRGVNGNQEFEPYATTNSSQHYEAICKLLGGISSNTNL